MVINPVTEPRSIGRPRPVNGRLRDVDHRPGDGVGVGRTARVLRPLGARGLRAGTGRADRHPRPRTLLPVRAIGPEDAWCEDPASRHYNQPVRLDGTRGGDRLRRDDRLYDFIIEIDHNTSPCIKGRGSAVFLHLARDNFGPTAGCVSMTKPAMLRLLQRLGPETRIVIG